MTPRAPSFAPSQPPAARARILYIEDNDDNRLLVRKLLEREGFEMIEATDGLSGIEQAQRERPDLILMDINLPGLGGNEATTRIKAMPALAATPVVAVTANALEGDKERSLAAGCDGYIEKPIDIDRFPDQVREFLGGRRERLEEGEEAPRYLRQYSQELAKRLEQELTSLQGAHERLEELDRLKDEFLRNISHELRTPLTPMQGNLELLAGGELGALTSRQRRALEAIQRNFNRLHALIENLLEFAGLEAQRIPFQYTSWKVAPLLEEVARDFAEEAGLETLRFEYRPPEGPLEIVADRRRMREVLDLLVRNAIKFTPNGGSIALGAERVSGTALAGRFSDKAAGKLHAGHDYIYLMVRDTGVGVPMGEREQVFEGFHQADGSLERRHGGAGLGLPIARRIVSAHGGALWASETPGGGATFEILLPLVPR